MVLEPPPRCDHMGCHCGVIHFFPRPNFLENVWRSPDTVPIEQLKGGKPRLLLWDFPVSKQDIGQELMPVLLILGSQLAKHMLFNIPSKQILLMCTDRLKISSHTCKRLHQLLLNERHRNHLSSDPVPSTSTFLTDLTLSAMVSHILKYSRPVEPVQGPGSSLVDAQMSSGRYIMN